MRHDLIVSKSIIINASPSKVWKGLTSPELIKKYLFGTQTITNWQPGSEIVFQGTYDGGSYRDHGLILEMVSNELISYSYWSAFSGLEDKPENYSTITYLIRKVADNQTEFTWTQKGYADESRYEHSESGMNDFLAQIKAVIEMDI